MAELGLPEQGFTGTINFWQVSKPYSNKMEQIMPTTVLVAPPNLLSSLKIIVIS